MAVEIVKEPEQESSSEADHRPDRELFDEAVAAANGGDAEGLERLEELLSQFPQIWQQVGDLNQHAIRTLVTLLAAGNVLAQQSILKSVEQLTDDLSEGNLPSVPEQLLIGGVVCSWLEVQLAINQSAGLGDESLVRSRFHLKLRDSSRRRFESAVRSLQQYRIREVELARIKEKVAAEAEAQQADYAQVLRTEYPWLDRRAQLVG